MRHLCMTLAAAALMASAGAAYAEPRRLTIMVDMTCPVSDPQLFEVVLKRQPGVLSVDSSYGDKWVVVIFENTLTDPRALVDALVDVGLGDMLADQPMIEEAAPAAKP